MNTRQVNQLVRNSLSNLAINTAQRIQSRRNQRNKPRWVQKDLKTVQRRPGFGSGGPANPRVVTKSMATNVSNAISGMQSATARKETGSENLGILMSGTVANVFAPVPSGNFCLNPAEPGLAPGLAAVANQFQRFRTGKLRFTYTPSASAVQNGIIYFAVYPDPGHAAPTSMEDMSATGNMRQFPVYGGAQTWCVEPSSIQAAYNVQSIDVKPVYSTDTGLNASGILWVATSGCASGIELGTLMWTYAYDLSLKKLTTAPTSLHAHYIQTDDTVGTTVSLGTRHLTGDAYETLIPTDTVGVYRMRQRQCRHLLMFQTQLAGMGVNHMVAETSADGVNFTNMPAIWDTTDGTYRIALHLIKRAVYIRLSKSVASDLTGLHVFMVPIRD